MNHDMSNDEVSDFSEFLVTMQTELAKAYMTGYRAAHDSCCQLIAAYRNERADMLEETATFVSRKMFRNKLEYNRAVFDMTRHSDCVTAMGFLLKNFEEHIKRLEKTVGEA